jgi:hypothetical protein
VPLCILYVLLLVLSINNIISLHGTNVKIEEPGFEPGPPEYKEVLSDRKVQ